MSVTALKPSGSNAPEPKSLADRMFLAAADALSSDDFDHWSDGWITVLGLSIYIKTQSGMFLSVDDKVDKIDRDKHRKIASGEDKPGGLSTANPSSAVATYFWEALAAFKRRRLDERLAPMERKLQSRRGNA